MILAKGTPTNADVGNYTIELKAYDIYGAFNIYTFWVNIMTNHAPITVSFMKKYCIDTRNKPHIYNILSPNIHNEFSWLF